MAALEFSCIINFDMMAVVIFPDYKWKSYVYITYIYIEYRVAPLLYITNTVGVGQTTDPQLLIRAYAFH